ncbi:TnsA endonuclease N-terminal domain-containing protein [Paenibacillus sp. FSL R7-0302]|uniref:TnsA endonuclease N-terminal domain-containing protein n=1 Tax=Paenibacillus sp. FSL R7-0302 TaxID=2921681 RepID=UPI0030FCD856
MDERWSLKTNWEVEDEIFKMKRKVNNRNSHDYPHIIGSFYSARFKKPVHYESLNERLFYYYLEIDRNVARYYEQPIEVPITKENGQKWNHIPDVIFFKDGSIPMLCQIKESEEEAEKDEDFHLINHYCEEFAQAQGWFYEVIYPKTLPEVYQRNLRQLKRFMHRRKYYAEWEEKVIQRLIYLGTCSIRRLAEQFSDRTDSLMLIPLVYYLIVVGVFIVDFNQPITSNSLVICNQGRYISPISL